MRRGTKIAAVVVVAGLVAALASIVAVSRLGTWPDPTHPATTLGDVEATVARHLPVPEVTDAELVQRLTKANIILFDVREADEFAQSHIAGARRIDPAMSADEFRRTYGPDLKGRSVVFYCAVGVRSGQMLSRVQAVLDAHQATAGFNLRGGIFRWHASGRPLTASPVSADGAPRSVHPYDARWGQLLERTLQPPVGQSRGNLK